MRSFDQKLMWKLTQHAMTCGICSARLVEVWETIGEIAEHTEAWETEKQR